jgi:hypothetical protein
MSVAAASTSAASSVQSGDALNTAHKTCLQYYYDNQTRAEFKEPRDHVVAAIATELQVDSKYVTAWFRQQRKRERVAATGDSATTSVPRSLPPVNDVSLLVPQQQLQDFVSRVTRNLVSGTSRKRRVALPAQKDDRNTSVVSEPSASAASQFRFTDAQKAVLAAAYANAPQLGTRLYQRSPIGTAQVATVLQKLGPGVRREQVSNWFVNRVAKVGEMLWPHQDALSRELSAVKRRVCDYVITQLLPYVVNDPCRLYETDKILYFLWRHYCPAEMIAMLDADITEGKGQLALRVSKACNEGGITFQSMQQLLSMAFESCQHTAHAQLPQMPMAASSSSAQADGTVPLVAFQLVSLKSFVDSGVYGDLSSTLDTTGVSVLWGISHLPELARDIPIIYTMMVTVETQEAGMHALSTMCWIAQLNALFSPALGTGMANLLNSILKKHKASEHKTQVTIYHEMHLECAAWLSQVTASPADAVVATKLLYLVIQLYLHCAESMGLTKLLVNVIGIDASKLTALTNMLRAHVASHWSTVFTRSNTSINTVATTHSSSSSSASASADWARQSLMKRLNMK